MNTWQSLTVGERKSILTDISKKTKMNENAIEKDWWVTIVLKVLFQTSCANYLNFKGGTSLSKGWGLIDRFSEDIDIAIDKSLWNIAGDTESQRDKLRKISRNYIQEVLCNELDYNLKTIGVTGFLVKFIDSSSSDTDPSVILITYPSVIDESILYVPPKVKVEISCRSLWEPCKLKEYQSIIAKYYSNEDFIDSSFKANTVYPSRTFLEKAFLLHEEFQKQKIRTVRMSRHLYDLEKIMDTKYAEEALKNRNMYDKIIQHRKDYTPIRGVNYTTHNPNTINFIPPERVMKDYQDDYKDLQESMIYGDSLSFDKLIERITLLNKRFRFL